MWIRAELKSKAKVILKKSYWKCFIVSLIIAIFEGTNGGSSGSHRSDSGDVFFDPYFVKVFATIAVGFILLKILVGYVLVIGGRKFYLKAIQKDTFELDSLGYGFRNNYLSIIFTMIWRGILLFLWTLLLIIPGIIKAYAYSMVPFILADRSDIGVRRAIELSNNMTRGHKWNMFVLDLSFIGWYLLGLLAFIVGIFFVVPYVHATKSELYLVLRKNALEQNMCSPDELNLAVE